MDWQRCKSLRFETRKPALKNILKLAFITLPLVALGAAVLGYAISTRLPPERSELSERATPVRVIEAQIQPMTPKIVGFGRVIPARTFNAIAQVGGTVEYVNPALQKGAILPAGSVLVRLSAVDFNLAIAQANANIRAAEARLVELTVSEVNQTSALVIETEALALQQLEVERTQSLVARNAVPQNKLYDEQSAFLAQRQKIQTIEGTLALLPTQREVQVEQIAVYRASLETAHLNLERTELTLPFAARVASTSVEVGQFVGVGQTVAILEGIDAAEVEAQVSVVAMRGLMRAAQKTERSPAVEPSFITDVLQGLNLTAEVNLSIGQDILTWPASMDRISNTIDQRTGMLGVIVRIDTAYSGAEPGYRPPLTKGMFVEVALKTAPVRGIVVPRNAIRNGKLLIVDDEDRLHWRPVSIGLMQESIALVTEGIDPGTRVVVSDLSPAIDGMLLTPIQDRALMARLAPKVPAE